MKRETPVTEGSSAAALAAANLPVGNTSFGVADWGDNGTPDVIAWDDSTGIVWVYPGEDGGATRFQIGSGFHGYTPFGAADWTGDGHTDLIIRNNADGALVPFVDTDSGLDGSSARTSPRSEWPSWGFA